MILIFFLLFGCKSRAYYQDVQTFGRKKRVFLHIFTPFVPFAFAGVLYSGHNRADDCAFGCGLLTSTV